jgi:hypothetical protein
LPLFLDLNNLGFYQVSLPPIPTTKADFDFCAMSLLQICIQQWKETHVSLSSSSSSSSSSYICHGVGPLVDPFRSHVSRRLFKVRHDSFCQSGSSVSLLWVIYYEEFYLHVVSSLSFIPVICPKLVLFLTPLQFVYSFCSLSKFILLFFSRSSSLLLLFFWRPLL